MLSQIVQRTTKIPTHRLRHMSIDLGRANIRMTQGFLDRPQIHPRQQQVRCIRMAQRIDTLLINSVLERSPTGFTRSLIVKSKSFVS